MPVSFIPFVFPGVDNVRCAFQTRWQEAGDGPYAGGNISLATADDRQSVIGNRRELRAARAFGAWPNSIRCTAMP